MDQLKSCSQSREVSSFSCKMEIFVIQHPFTVMRNAAARELYYTNIQREYNDRIKGRVARIIESLAFSLQKRHLVCRRQTRGVKK